jgi:hypothetical protein
MNNFTNHNIPGCVSGDCLTCFYDKTVSTKLLLKNGKYAIIEEWDLSGNIPHPKASPEELLLNSFEDDNYIKIIKITKIPITKEEIDKLYYATLNARHLNIRLILPKHKYPSKIKTNIDNYYTELS